MRRRIVVLLAFALVIVATKAVIAQQPACPTPKTWCEGEGGYYASHEDREALAGATDPILKELRSCLDGVGGKNVDATIVVRFDADGKAATTTVEAPGYESQICVARVMAKLALLKNPRETKVRCSYGCPKPAASPSATGATTSTPPSGDAGAAPLSDGGASSPPPPPPSTEEIEKQKYRFAFKGQAGYELAAVYGVAVHSARFRAAFGSQNDVTGRYFVLDGRWGSTANGLTSFDVRAGGEIEPVKTGIAHFGLGAAAGIMGVNRVTNGRTLLIPTLGLYFHGGVDLVQWGPRNDHALQLDLRLEAHVFFTGYYFGPGVVLGFRY
jgi:hypothetical protein